MSDIQKQLFEKLMQAYEEYAEAREKSLTLIPDEDAWEWVNRKHPNDTTEQKEEYYEAYLAGVVKGFQRGVEYANGKQQEQE